MAFTVELHKRLPIELKWAAVVAISIWPDDPKVREDFLALLCLSAVSRKIPPGKIKDVLLAAPEATPFSSMEGRIRQRLYPALQAGGYLHEAVALSSLGMKFSMKRLRWLMVSGFGGLPGAATTPKQFVDRVWPTYRPVAHLWAAYHHRWMDEINDGVPCAVNALPAFVSLAEGFRILGEQTKTRGQGTGGASRTLLSPGSSIALPRVPQPTRPTFDCSNYSNYDYSFDPRE